MKQVIFNGLFQNKVHIFLHVEENCSSGNQQVKVISSDLNNNDDCVGDVNGDRNVDVSDLLDVLSQFGKIC